MATRISAAAAILLADAAVDLVDGDANPGKLIIYDGTRPANADTTITTQNVLVTFILGDPSFGNAVDTVTGGVSTANAVTPVQATAAGTATFFRIVDGANVVIIDGTVSDAAGTGDLKLSSTSIISGIDVTVVSLTVTMPKGA